MGLVTGRHFSRAETIVLAFFLGGAVSAVAFDMADYLNYNAQSSGAALSPLQQAFYYSIFPFLFYFAFFVAGYIIFRFDIVPPRFVLYFYVITVVIALYLSFSLPQVNEPFFTLTVILGTMVTIGSVYGMRKSLRGR